MKKERISTKDYKIMIRQEIDRVSGLTGVNPTKKQLAEIMQKRMGRSFTYHYYKIANLDFDAI